MPQDVIPVAQEATLGLSQTKQAIEPGVSLSIRLGWVSFFNDASSEVLARAMPLFLTATLGASPTLVGAIEGLSETVSILLKGFSGWLSDRMSSRKPLVVFGYSCSLLSRAVLLATSLPLAVGLIRILDRTGKGLRSAPRDAMIADAAALGRAGHAFGITRFLDTLGAVTGIALVVALGLGNGPMTIDAFRTFVLIALPFGLLSLIILIFFVPRIPRQVTAKKYFAIHIPKEIRGYLAIVGIFSLGNSSDAFLVLKAQQIGYSFRQTLIILIFFNLLAAVLAIPAGKLSDRYGRVRFLAAGWIVYAAAYFCIGTFDIKEVFIAAVFAYGAFYGLTEGIEKALLADLLPKEQRGVGFGSLQLVLGLAALPASLLMGFLMTRFGSATAFSVSAAFAASGAALLIVWAFMRSIRTSE